MTSIYRQNIFPTPGQQKETKEEIQVSKISILWLFAENVMMPIMEWDKKVASMYMNRHDAFFLYRNSYGLMDLEKSGTFARQKIVGYLYGIKIYHDPSIPKGCFIVLE